MAGILLPARIYGVIGRLRYRSCLENRAAASLCGVPGGEAVPMPGGLREIIPRPIRARHGTAFAIRQCAAAQLKRYGDGLWNYLAVQIHPIAGDGELRDIRYPICICEAVRLVPAVQHASGFTQAREHTGCLQGLEDRAKVPEFIVIRRGGVIRQDRAGTVGFIFHVTVRAIHVIADLDRVACFLKLDIDCRFYLWLGLLDTLIEIDRPGNGLLLDGIRVVGRPIPRCPISASRPVLRIEVYKRENELIKCRADRFAGNIRAGYDARHCAFDRVYLYHALDRSVAILIFRREHHSDIILLLSVEPLQWLL